jgi:hypothetical protein
MNNTTKWMTFGIMLALVLWGIYLAVGATGFFVQASMTDTRKSLVVLVCMAMFLGLWIIVLRRTKPRSDDSTAEVAASPATPPQSWSTSGIAAVVMLVIGGLLWLAAISSWNDKALSTTTILGWLAALNMTGSATAGMVALSDRRHRKGKWLGLAGLIGLAGSLIGFIARMTP